MHAVAERMKVLTNWQLSSHSLRALSRHGRKHWNLLLQPWPLFGESCAHCCMRFIGNNHGVHSNSEEAIRHPRHHFIASFNSVQLILPNYAFTLLLCVVSDGQGVSVLNGKTS